MRSYLSSGVLKNTFFFSDFDLPYYATSGSTGESRVTVLHSLDLPVACYL